MLLPQAFAANKRIVKLTNISRDKEVWGDNASVNGQVFESVLIPQHAEDDRKKATAAAGVMFLLQSKSPSGQDSLFPILCTIMPNVKEKNHPGRHAGCGMGRSGFKSEGTALPRTSCIILRIQPLHGVLLGVRHGHLLSSQHYHGHQQSRQFSLEGLSLP